MAISIVSSKYQVVIPRAVREKAGIAPGQRLEVFAFDDRIELVPVQPMKKLRGFLKGIDTTVRREDDRV